MSDVPNELIVGLWSLTLSAKGNAALLLVPAVTVIVIACRIAGISNRNDRPASRRNKKAIGSPETRYDDTQQGK